MSSGAVKLAVACVQTANKAKKAMSDLETKIKMVQDKGEMYAKEILKKSR